MMAVLTRAQRHVAVSAPANARRHLSVHEHVAMDILSQYNVPTPAFKAAHSAEEAFTAAKSFNGKKLVLVRRHSAATSLSSARKRKCSPADAARATSRAVCRAACSSRTRRSRRATTRNRVRLRPLCTA